MPTLISVFRLSLAIFLSSSHFLLGCATPSEKFIDKTTSLGFSQQEVNGTSFRHRLFLNAQAMYINDIEELHVYLDGDGTPWTRSSRIADDPTPRNPLILELMEQDRAPAILLGRPCYYGLNLSHSCNNSLWTSHRYSSEVVNSMRDTLNQWISTKKVNKLVLIGYSGGGALATLLASHLNKTSAVVTIAANLDIKGWSDYHGYLQPSGSLNPIADARIPPHVRQIHLAGLKDENVPAKIIESFSLTQKNALFLPQAEFEHTCCWTNIWPEILNTYLKQ